MISLSPRPFKFIYIEQVLGFSSAAPRLANCPIFLGNSREHLLGMCHGEMVLEVNAEVPYGGTGGCRSYGVDAELNSVVWHGRISGVDEHRLTSFA